MNIVWKRRVMRSFWFIVAFFWFFMVPVRRVYRYVSRHPIMAAKCLVECGGEFLLVRINYAHRRWGVAGGGVNRGESFGAAAIRELYEEVGITADTVHHLGMYEAVHEKCPVTNHVYLYRAKNKDFEIDWLEIAEAAWFKPHELPSPRQTSVDNILAMYKNLSRTPTQQ